MLNTRNTFTILALLLAVALFAPIASAQNTTFNPTAGSAINISAGGGGALIFASALPGETINFLVSSQGVPTNCTEAPGQIPSNTVYMLIWCAGAAKGDYTYTVRTNTLNGDWGSATYTLHLY